jgi:hypothetical protein
MQKFAKFALFFLFIWMVSVLIPPYNYATSVIPGWQTTLTPTYPLIGWLLTMLCLLQILLLAILRYFKVQLPYQIRNMANLNLLMAVISTAVVLNYIRSWDAGYIAQFNSMKQIFGRGYSGYYFVSHIIFLLPLLWWLSYVRQSPNLTLLIATSICMIWITVIFFPSLGLLF